jgi:hypothetical protein
MGLLERIVRLVTRIVELLVLAVLLLVGVLALRWLLIQVISPEPSLNALGELIGPLLKEPAFKLALVLEAFIEVVVLFVLGVRALTKNIVRIVQWVATIRWGVSEGIEEPGGLAPSSAIIFIASIFLIGSVLKIVFLK